MARTKYYNPTTQRWEYADRNPLPTGENGDILVNENGVWVAKPKWQMIYQPVEWIEGTGTQYIDTGVISKSTTRIVSEQAATVTTLTDGMLNGWTDGTRCFAWGVDQSGFSCNVSDNYTWVNFSPTIDTNRHTFDIQSGSQNFDGVEYGTTVYTYTALKPIYLFGRYVSTINNVKQPCKERKYSCKIYDDGNLVRDFVPVRNVFTGEAGLYDTVNGKFYGNDGTGTFLKGADI